MSVKLFSAAFVIAAASFFVAADNAEACRRNHCGGRGHQNRRCGQGHCGHQQGGYNHGSCNQGCNGACGY